jgi:acetyltransferase-like isoleucine patch superfamily enzyme
MAHRTEKEKMLAGELYRAAGPEIVADAMRADRLLRAYNTTETVDEARRLTLLHELLGSVGKNVTVRSPFYCDYGYNISLGSLVFYILVVYFWTSYGLMSETAAKLGRTSRSSPPIILGIRSCANSAWKVEGPSS